MFGKNHHIGESNNNNKMKKMKINKMHIIVASIILVIIIIVLITIGNLSNLMGNSVVSQYYCEDPSYKLDGDKCVKEIKANPAFLGDINLDNKVSEEDLNLLTEYADLVFMDEQDKSNLSNLQVKVSDINEDGEVYYNDESILREYLSGSISTYGAYFENIGVKRLCEEGYTLKNDYCIKEVIVPALVKENKLNDSNDDIINTPSGSINSGYSNYYKIHYEANGGVGRMSDQSALYGRNNLLKNNLFKRVNYNFLGWNAYDKNNDLWYCYSQNNELNWYKENECSSKYLYKNREKFIETNDNYNIIIMYAQWSDEYIIDYNANGGIGETSSQTIHYNNPEQLITNNFSKDNNYFMGWRIYRSIDDSWYCYASNDNEKKDWLKKSNCDKNGYVIFKNEQIPNFNTIPSSNITLYAQWLGFELKDDLSKKKTSGSYIMGADDKKININAKISSNNTKYYYKWLTYRYDTQSYESKCSILSNNIDKSMDLTLGPRKGKFVIYYDSQCLDKALDIYTKSYTHDSYKDSSKVSVQISPSKMTTTNVYNNEKIVIKNIDKVDNIPNNTIVNFDVDYKLFDKSKEYYYYWLILDEKNSVLSRSEFIKINENDKLTVDINFNYNDNKMRNASEIYGIFIITTLPDFLLDRHWLSGVERYNSNTSQYAVGTLKYKFKKYIMNIDTNGGKTVQISNGEWTPSKMKQIKTESKNIINNNGDGYIRENIYKEGYDIAGFRLKNSKGNYFCYTNTNKTKKDFTSASNCKEYGYIILTKADNLPEEYINDKVIIETQWTDKPVEVKISNNKKTKYKKDEKITNTISFKVNSNAQKYYYKIQEKHFSLSGDTKNWTDKQIIKNLDIYSKDYLGTNSYWNGFALASSQCQEVKDSTQATYTLPIKQEINVMGVVIYRDSSCRYPIDSIKNVYQNPQIYRCTNCK